MNDPKTTKKWLLRSMPENASGDQINNISRDQGIPTTIVKLLALRGFTGIQQIADFMAPSLQQLPRPHLIKGMDTGVAILLDSLKFQQPVTVYGDFDADGVTATALLSMFLNELGIPQHMYIPNRLTEGYGLNSGALKKIYDHNMQQWNEAGVLLTADCGISDVDVVAEAKKLGFAVIITDHHKPPDELPPADAILNPLQSDCPFPCKNLAGVGVAFYLILGLRSALMTNGHWPADRIPNLKSYMDLVAIGTVADQVPVTGCNRIIVKAGLEIINQAQRVGLQKLPNIARNNGSPINTEDIAFRMAPRINAAGRIGSAAKAVELLTTTETTEAQKFAEELDTANNLRKDIEATIFDEAVHLTLIEPHEPAGSLVLHKSDWHQGVLGIVASRLTEKYNCPTILLTECSDKDDAGNKYLKGSGRSINGLDIHQAVAGCHEILVRFGGHEGAVGLTLHEQDLEQFKILFDRAVRSQVMAGTASTVPSLLIDSEISLPELTDVQFLSSYDKLAPFGRGNEEPVFLMKNQRLVNLREVGSRHLRFSVQDDDRIIHGIGFNLAHHLPVAQQTDVDLAFSLRFNTYRGNNSWELRLLDIKPSQ
jgi:single-stranded-DNA-specific exonuclease